jgi:hypothetical protein
MIVRSGLRIDKEGRRKSYDIHHICVYEMHVFYEIIHFLMVLLTRCEKNAPTKATRSQSSQSKMLTLIVNTKSIDWATHTNQCIYRGFIINQRLETFDFYFD